MDPTQQPIQAPPEIFVSKPKPNYLKTILLSGLVILLVVSIIYLYLQNQKLQQQVLNPQLSPTIQVLSPTSQSISPTPKTVSSISITPDETAGWKTYTNSVLGLELKYPPNWKSVIDCKFGTTCFSSENFEQTVNEVGDGGGFYIAKKGGLFSISSSLKDASINLDNYCHPGGPLLITSCVDTKLDELNAKKRILNIQDGAEYSTEVGALTNKFLIMLGQNYSSQSDKKILDQILSTFKFLNEPSKCLTVEDPCNPQSCNYDLSKCTK